ncbi:cyclic pyranopterin monophosphate synthase, mitochondrial [Andrographis paniculata]|uniref:cyclic pyranopterin monophosphate synthase, mitochondrial n=1 Tax=Andrographis paniculata TaxID=175694 RepID=UPI0021E8A390|nr:cyclic pyranopterin monophosphate synthase, mitochondrial [Andrographis paniculata]
MFLRRFVSTLEPVPKIRSFSSYSSHDFASEIAELNQEMESVFGEPPSSSFPAGSGGQKISPESHPTTSKTPQNESNPGLTHVDNKGESQMVDITSKGITNRVAIASCKVLLGRRVFELVSANQMEKGDVLGVAKIAGIMGAKQTSNLIPLCHGLNLSHVQVDLTLNACDLSVDIVGKATCSGKTGVEMEALSAVAVAGLTVYDMCKAASKNIVVTDLRLEHKSGGKSGEWSSKKP